MATQEVRQAVRQFTFVGGQWTQFSELEFREVYASHQLLVNVRPQQKVSKQSRYAVWGRSPNKNTCSFKVNGTSLKSNRWRFRKPSKPRLDVSSSILDSKKTAHPLVQDLEKSQRVSSAWLGEAMYPCCFECFSRCLRKVSPCLTCVVKKQKVSIVTAHDHFIIVKPCVTSGQPCSWVIHVL